MADAVIEELTPIQNEFKRLVSDEAYIRRIMEDGAEQARIAAAATLAKAYHAMGFDADKRKTHAGGSVEPPAVCL